MSSPSHGEQRAGLITATDAKTIMSGGAAAWETLIAAKWADDGSDFATAIGGARGHGHEQEPLGRAKFWERHPEYEIEAPGLVPFGRRGFTKDHPYRRLLACSPDGKLIARSCKIGHPPVVTYGLEVKSPVEEGTFLAYNADLSRRTVPMIHVEQVRFSLWITGWDGWHYAIHHGERYAELLVTPDSPEQQAWIKRFRPRLDAFITQYLAGQPPVRDKLDASGLASLIRRTT